MKSPRLSSGHVMLIRHRALNYQKALRAERNDLVINEMRNLLHDLLGPEEILELASTWLNQRRRDERDERATLRRVAKAK